MILVEICVQEFYGVAVRINTCKEVKSIGWREKLIIHAIPKAELILQGT